MAEATQEIPVGVYPYLTVKGGKAAIEFYKKAFAAVEEFRNTTPQDKIMHARIRVNGQAILLSDDFPEFRGGAESPPPAGVGIHLQVDDADKWWKRAVDAGATVRMELGDQFWGDRDGQLADPFGHSWSIASAAKP